MRTLILAFLLCGCTGYLENNLEADTEEARELVIAEWSLHLDAELLVEESPPVTWHPEGCIDPPVGLMNDPPDCILGYYHNGSPGEIHLATPSIPLIARSAFAHEFLHWSLRVSRDDSDGDHSGEEWCLVDDVNRVLLDHGL